MRKPNFFILGAPKCATTSLAVWLGEHPAIFMSCEKEPHFFNTDDRQGIATLDGYEGLFRKARPEHIAVGEASVWYLSSSVAVENILHYQPAASFIAMVRNPVEMAPAVHAEMVISGHETVRDFSEAWKLQEERRGGRRLPAFGWAARRMLYGEVCSLGAQIEQLLSTVAKERVLIVVLDDIRSDARQEYLRVLNFLGVPDDGRTAFSAYNTARVARFPRLTRLLFILAQMKRQFHINNRTNFYTIVAQLNQLSGDRAEISSEILQSLKEYFHEDVQKLGQLLDRDFAGWCS